MNVGMGNMGGGYVWRKKKDEKIGRENNERCDMVID